MFYLLSLLAIAAVLAAGHYLVDAIKGAAGARDRLAQLLAVQAQVDGYRQEQTASLAARMGKARDLPLGALDEQIRNVNRELAGLMPDERGDLALLLGAGPERYGAQLAGRYRSRVARTLLQQELAYLQQLRGQLVALQSRAAAREELARLLARHRGVYAKLMEKRREVAQLDWLAAKRIEHPWARGPKLDRLAADVNALTAENTAAAAAYRAQATALRRMQTVGELAAFVLDTRQLEAALHPLREQVAAARDALAANWLTRVGEPLRQALPLAGAILLLAIAGRAAIRAVFYFVLAPLATRGAALPLDRARAGKQDGQGASGTPAVALLSPSAVSQTLHLAPDEELLLLPRYLQSAPVGAARRTRWLVRGRAWASLSAGMTLLTCVRTRSADEQVVLSASDDGLSEIALLRIPAGAALAIQPRALVGLVARQGGQIDVRWQWRLASLHAWLTLQLRFFVVRGPLTLAVQGKRGVRLQQARATHAVRQNATLGFSTDVAYSTVRSEPFLPYLRGQAPLLHDRFGGAGVYLYDETPGAGDRPGRVSRGLEGISDALLKLLGY